MNDQFRLKSLYAQILQGYTYSYLNNGPLVGPIYFKHLTPIDHSRIDIECDTFIEKARNYNVLTREEKIATLKDEDLWPNDIESKIFELKDTTSRQKTTVKKLAIPSQIELLHKEINKNTKQLESLERELEELIGYTAESYAGTRINQTYTYHCCYSNSNLTKLKFTKKEFDELEDDALSQIVNAYNSQMSSFDDLTLKKIAIADFFTCYFSICKDSPMVFYGKSVSELSSFQSQLFVLGLYYKQIMNKYDDMPDDVMRDPEKLTEWHEIKEGIANRSNSGVDTSSNFSMIGANKEDYKKMGYEDGIDLSKVARERKGNLSMRDIIELQKGKK